MDKKKTWRSNAVTGQENRRIQHKGTQRVERETRDLKNLSTCQVTALSDHCVFTITLK